MASNIKGITIEISGNTTKLQDALKGVNKTIYNCNSELKQLNQALKLDPKNTELLAQKQDVLKKNIEATTSKLNDLKTAQKQMGDYNSLTEEQKENYRALSVEITKTEANLKGLNNELKETKNVKLEHLKEGFEKFASAAKKAAEVAAASIAAIGAAAVATAKKIWNLAKETAQYGDTIEKNSQKVGLSMKSYQQWDYAMNLAGTSMQDCTNGLKTLTNTFDDANNGSKSAQEKFKRLGISLDDLKGKSREEVFGETVKALQNISDETTKAALANDMFGKSGQNLLPLFNQTNEETEKLLQEAEKYGMVMSDDAVKASADFQDSLTKLKGTLNGVKNSMMGDFLPSLTLVMDGLSDIFAGVEGGSDKLKSGIDGILGNVDQMIPKVIDFLTTIADVVLDNAPMIIESLAKGILNAIPKLLPTISKVIISIVQSLTKMLPDIIKVGIQVIVELAKGLTEALPELIPAIVEAVITMVDTLLDNIDLLVDAAIELIMALAEGIINALPILIEKIPTIIEKLVDAIVRNLPKLIEAAIKLVIMLAKGILENLGPLLEAAVKIVIALAKGIVEALGKIFELGWDIIKSLIDGLADNISKLWDWARELPGKIKDKIIEGLGKIKDVGKDLINGLINGMKEGWEKLKDGVADLGGKVVDKFKKVFGIHSPSRVMKEEIGKNLGLGLVEGIEETEKQVNDAMSQLASGIDASVNPTINPTANSNPLIIQIENFNNTRESDIESLAQELEFYRRNSALAKGGMTTYE